MMYIAIVGSSKAPVSVRPVIKKILEKYDPFETTIVTGGAPGVDMYAYNQARELGFEVMVFEPRGEGWEFYKERNLKIAEASDHVYSIALTLQNTRCYHCKNAGRDDNHEKTAGCYTGKENGNYTVIVAE